MPKKKAKPPVEKLIPSPIVGINNWIIFGLDPSLTRTGYAVMDVHRHCDSSRSRWLEVGSVKPDDPSDPIWVRCKAIAGFLRTRIRNRADCPSSTGLIISMEYPTPRNDFLVGLNRIIHLVLFDHPGLPIDPDDPSVISNNYATVRVQLTNAATMRSLMGLTMRGADNKKENIAKAYEFIDRERYPHLDTDSCDAVLMAMMARHTASYMLGLPDEPPAPFQLAFTNAKQEVKGKGTRARVITKGLLHRPEYWYRYEPKSYGLIHYDAREKLTRPRRSQVII